jgi:four helix bundle protein
MYASDFHDLIVYQHARAVSREIFVLSKGFPKEEMFSLTDQIRRCSRSVGAQIAESWAKRRYERHFISKLSDADGEQMETRHWLGEAADCGYITSEIAQRLASRLESIGRMLNQMMLKAPLFCQDDARVVQEARPSYGSIDEFFAPATEHQSPVTDHRSPVTDHRSPVTDHRSLDTDHRTPN